MTKWIAKVHDWWKPPTHSEIIASPYSISCACGQTAAGFRKSDFQIVRCPRCRGELFVLPLSPLPSISTESQTIAAVALSPPIQVLGKLPKSVIAAGIIVFALVALSISVTIVYFQFTDASVNIPDAQSVLSEADFIAKKKMHLQQADKHLANGDFNLALHHLNQLLDLHHNQAQPPDAPELHALNRRRDEIALYADLAQESLEEITRHAFHVSDKEWQAIFEKRYRDKAVIFDATVHRVNDQIRLVHAFQWHDERIQLNLDELAILKNLPLEQPRRFLFGARLDKIQRSGPRIWSVHLASGSLVLLTDPVAAAASSPALSLPDAVDVLKNQERILEMD